MHNKSYPDEVALPQPIVSDKETVVPFGYIQFLPLSPSSNPVDIFINGVKIYKQISYKQLTNRLPLPPSSYHIDIYPAGIMVSSLLSRKIEILPQAVHTMALSGEANDMKLTDTQTSARTTEVSRAKFIHLVSDGPRLQPLMLTPKSEELPPLQYRQSSTWLSVSPGIIQGCLYGHPYRDYLTPFRFSTQPQRDHLIYIFGSITGNPPLDLIVLT